MNTHKLTPNIIHLNINNRKERPGRMISIIQKGIIPGRTQSQEKKFLNQSTM